MDFGGFLGNDSLKNRLTAAERAGKMSHSYLISGPEGSGKRTLARTLAAALQCTSSGEKPCRQCAQCRKVLADVHPDVVVVDDPEKKTVRVELSRWAKTDLYIRPNEGRKKIYLFPRAQDMNPSAQNAMLKVMEEPPEYGVFLLLADRAESLLTTVRSRCVELSLSPVGEAEALPFLRQQFPQTEKDALRAAFSRSGGFVGQAMALLQNGGARDERAEAMAAAFAAGDRLTMAGTLCKMEKLKREQLLPILRQTQELVAEALSVKARRCPAAGAVRLLAEQKTAAVLLQAYKDLQRAMDAANANVGVGHVCGFLASRLR